MGWHAFRSCNSKKDGTFYRNDDWGLDLLFLEPMSRKGSQITRIATVSCHIPADHSHAARRLSLPMATLQSEICICVSRIKQAYECHFPLFKIFFSWLPYHKVSAKHTDITLLFFSPSKEIAQTHSSICFNICHYFHRDGLVVRRWDVYLLFFWEDTAWSYLFALISSFLKWFYWHLHNSLNSMRLTKWFQRAFMPWPERCLCRYHVPGALVSNPT